MHRPACAKRVLAPAPAAVATQRAATLQDLCQAVTVLPASLNPVTAPEAGLDRLLWRTGSLPPPTDLVLSLLHLLI
jgi:hypothetical protein